MLETIHQYGYFFSLLLLILPVSLAFDKATGFNALKALASRKGFTFMLISVIFWSLFDIFWVRGLGTFPDNRILFKIGGVPIEEMLFFVIGFYNIAAIFSWSKRKYS